VTEREALLHAICLDPAEDTPRLVYADWLDEHGDENDRASAEQIRVQVEFVAERIELPWRHPTVQGITGIVSRGFVAEIDLPMQLYLTHGTDLFRQHPITVVHLSDKSPFRDTDDGKFGWGVVFGYSTGRSPSRFEHVLPSEFYAPMIQHPLRVTRHLLRFETPVEAQVAASEIAVNLGRKLNNLPPLPLTLRARQTDPPD
jgi:uncharacterized protein (TIGR02996 family)